MYEPKLGKKKYVGTLDTLSGFWFVRKYLSKNTKRFIVLKDVLYLKLKVK